MVISYIISSIEQKIEELIQKYWFKVVDARYMRIKIRCKIALLLLKTCKFHCFEIGGLKTI